MIAEQVRASTHFVAITINIPPHALSLLLGKRGILNGFNALALGALWAMSIV